MVCEQRERPGARDAFERKEGRASDGSKGGMGFRSDESGQEDVRKGQEENCQIRRVADGERDKTIADKRVLAKAVEKMWKLYGWRGGQV